MRALITPAELADLTDVVLLDIRWQLGGPPGIDEYQRGHIPGAVYLDLDRDLAGPPGTGGRHPLPESDALQQTLRAAGIRQNHKVVAYDSGNGTIAARAWWLLRWAGHKQVAVLDGGYRAWVAEERPTSVETPTPEPGDITVVPGGMPVINAEEAAELTRTGVLLDARAPERYRGVVEPIDPRAGHVPGALNAPCSGHIAESGRWHSPAELAARFKKIGVTAGQPIGAYCGSGVTASSVVLALEVAGLGTAQLYAGSWSQWCVDPNRPVATGPELC